MCITYSDLQPSIFLPAICPAESVPPCAISCFIARSRVLLELLFSAEVTVLNLSPYPHFLTLILCRYRETVDGFHLAFLFILQVKSCVVCQVASRQDP